MREVLSSILRVSTTRAKPVKFTVSRNGMPAFIATYSVARAGYIACRNTRTVNVMITIEHIAAPYTK